MNELQLVDVSQGDSYAIHHALDIMYAAVERYKQLAEGPSRGEEKKTRVI